MAILHSTHSQRVADDLLFINAVLKDLSQYYAIAFFYFAIEANTNQMYKHSKWFYLYHTLCFYHNRVSKGQFKILYIIVFFKMSQRNTISQAN